MGSQNVRGEGCKEIFFVLGVSVTINPSNPPIIFSIPFAFYLQRKNKAPQCSLTQGAEIMWPKSQCMTVWASDWVFVQSNMVKPHMATGRNTPPPQQHLLWLNIHSGKKRRWVFFFFNKENQPPFCKQPWCESAAEQWHAHSRRDHLHDFLNFNWKPYTRCLSVDGSFEENGTEPGSMCLFLCFIFESITTMIWRWFWKDPQKLW